MAGSHELLLFLKKDRQVDFLAHEFFTTAKYPNKNWFDKKHYQIISQLLYGRQFDYVFHQNLKIVNQRLIKIMLSSSVNQSYELLPFQKY